MFREGQYPEIPKELLGNDAAPSPAWLLHPQSALESLQGAGLKPEGLNPKVYLHFPWIQSYSHGFIPLGYRSMESQTLCVLMEGKQELGAEGVRMQ